MTDVLVAGAGPTGLTLAIELARRGVAVRIVDRDPNPFTGSRGDGIQPRTLEVFEDLGILPKVLAEGMLAATIRAYFDGAFVSEQRMAEIEEPTPDVPYPNAWFLAQYRTEELLAERLAELGVEVERGTELTGFIQDADGVTATVDGRHVRVRYLVGADGGASVVRRTLGIPFPGITHEEIRMLLGDVECAELDHDYGHWFAKAGNPMDGVVLTPLPGGRKFQFGCPLPAGTDASIEHLQARVDERGGTVRLHDLTWSTVWRPNIRLADAFRDGRVFLAGDAAHVHPPTGGQGLNTGVQDGYNLGWKLAAVLRGSPEALLGTYETERRAVAEEVLSLTTRLMDKHRDGEADAHHRGSETRQLGISYRGGPLAVDRRSNPGELRAGDRAPDAPVLGQDGEPARLFELLARPEWTVIGDATVAGARTLKPGESFVDHEGHVRAAYGPGVALIRPDGHVSVLADDAAGLPTTVDELIESKVG
ncbi:MAG TPA: FAD-dependent monooxygenase [Actinophytocola sp.]|jgi:2-polyprenyl-6-methoxyphenol hydroxylase-like FAD-dependent oxidoreductase|nr:FAD-dependent monooxygenase [Actinophytocola sp.]